jgi:hypothetical protein
LDAKLYIQGEDVLKIMNVFLDKNMMTNNLLSSFIEKITADEGMFTYEIFKELSIIFSTKVLDDS